MLAGPTPSGSTSASRFCRGCSRPPRRFPAQAAPSFAAPLRQGQRRKVSHLHSNRQRLTAHSATTSSSAGRSDPLFSDDAITLIHEAARGLPRAVNNIGLQALVAAYAGRKAIVDHDSAHAAVAEVTSD